MRVIEKKWTDNIYELVIFENPNIRYRLSVYNYANSTIRLARYNRYTMTYKVLFDTKLTKDNYIKAVKITKLLVINERSKYGKEERSHTRSYRNYSQSSDEKQNYFIY